MHGGTHDPEQRGLVEETLLEPTIPHGGALTPRLFTIRPFLWLVLGVGVAGVAFWAALAALFAQAAFRFGASSTEMAILGLSISAPYAIVVPIQGILVDRWSPKWLNLLGYVMLVAAIAVAWAAESLAFLYASCFLVGAAFAAIEPARSSLIGLLVDERRLVQANGMVSAASQVAVMGGTLTAGVLTDSAGVPTVYGSALLLSVVSLGFNLAVPDVRQGGERPAVALRDLAEGMRTARRVPELRMLLAIGCVAWFMVTVFFVLEPLFIKEVLGQGESAVSYLWFTHGVGAAIGAVAVSRLRRGAGRELLLVSGGVTVVGAGLLLLATAALFPVAFVGEALMGAGFSFIFAPGLALIQRVVGEEQRGRVTAIFGSLQESMGIVSTIAVAVLGSLVVVRPTLAAAGAAVAVTGLAGLRAAIRLRARTASRGA